MRTTATAVHTIRLIIDPALDGPTNMARDEALLIRVGRGDAPPTLRLYQWEPETVSLGYFQSYEELRTQPDGVRALPAVRRLTGGGAIVHANELTYSLTLPLDHPLLGGGPMRLYELVHDAAIAMLKQRGVPAQRMGCQTPGGNSRRGPFLCFQRRYAWDVVSTGRKVVGSAQRRARNAVLQHGSIQLFEVPGLDRARFAPDNVAGPFVNALGEFIHASFAPLKWHQDTLGIATDLFDKYAGKEWTRRR
jgi:lipoate-protein ligase A